ncbi:hypothetical protein BT63DRAFT_448843 [Microthyrium microscopicum]|uniref:F-box domain-containing protein n=1 Tax=Microthyrium microscopicum TaxID=703497 RepID=A0A6A6TWF4_9PEZI|nr:hypothetical protein BT63DRAFT_448843 [Microthyrium microscopicum]
MASPLEKPSPTLRKSADSISSTSTMLSRMRSLKGPEQEVPSKRPLEFLDLPVDVLREIIGHLPHANDLTSLALSHSVLHSLAIPCIYSRFDIVWPDQGMQSESRAGVDALTYGLATLVKAQEIFGEAAFQHGRRGKKKNNNSALLPSNPYPLRRRRLGNYYASYTKKFSLGNGPADCVREYLITKEGGKMLGTLVALAVARMQNLEAFVWDMPTGVLRDVWLALSSLGDTEDEDECRLEKVWVRWHNNWQTDISDGPPPPPPPNVPPPNLGANANHNSNNATIAPISADLAALPLIDRVEYPSFSVLPALKSLTVLEIDELAYLDEMSILIARSQHRLKELRIGIARHARNMDWTGNWQGDAYYQVDHRTTWTIASNVGDKRLEGVLGVLVGRIHNLRNNAESSRTEFGREFIAKVLEQQHVSEEVRMSQDQSDEATTSPETTAGAPHEEDAHRIGESYVPEFNATSRGSVMSSSPPDNESRENLALSSPVATSPGQSSHSLPTPTLHTTNKVIPLRPARPLRSEAKKTDKDGPFLNGCLKLETLELERVPLSLPVFRQAFDFTTITNLTLINCVGHERLWKQLRSRYGPIGRRGSMSYRMSAHGYLNLKKIHTDTVSSQFLHFVKETLRPNTLETLFLQDRWGSPVSVGSIFKYAVRRHRASLKRLLIDSSHLEDLFTEGNSRWRKWRLSRKMVAYLTSGRMSSLRELAVSIEYADWHIFLQRLPRVHQLRSLFIPHIADHPQVGLDTHDLAMQIVDIVTLRPEIELCYMGLGTKCFEILENRPLPSPSPTGTDYSLASSGVASSGRTHHDSDGSDDEDRGTLSDDDATDDDATFDDASEASDELDEDAALDDDDGASLSDSDDEWESTRRGKRKASPKLRLQEILFYDKIAIFKARYGRL